MCYSGFEVIFTATPTLEKLWMGDIRPAAEYGKRNAELNNLTRLIDINREKLKAGLTQKQTEILNTYDDCLDEYIFMKSEEAFCEGFSLGCRLMAESLVVENSNEI